MVTGFRNLKNKFIRWKVFLFIFITSIITFISITTISIAAAKYSGFEVDDEITIFLNGTSDDKSIIKYSLNTLIDRFELYNLDYPLIEKQYEIYYKQDELYEENDTTYREQIDSYELIINQAITDGDSVTQAYYESMLQEIKIAKANNKYNQALNQFYIDNEVQLKINEKRKIRTEFIKKVYSLIPLQYQLESLERTRAYNYRVSKIQKIKFDHGEIMRSEYNIASSDVDVLNGRIQSIEEQIEVIINDIRESTGLNSKEEYEIILPLHEAKNYQAGIYKSFLDNYYLNQLDDDYILHQISCKTELIDDLIGIYGMDTIETEMIKLEKDKLHIQLSQLIRDYESIKNSLYSSFISSKGLYEANEEQTGAYGELAFEKYQLYKIKLATELDWYKAQVDRDNSKYMTYSYVVDVVELIKSVSY